MIIKCIAIDDEPLALKHVSNFINATPFLELVETCDSAFSAIAVLNNKQVDLMFIDINMPDLSGMDFVKSLEHKPKVIFTTAYSDYAVEGYRVDALDYLLKPFNYQEFLSAANKALKMLQNESHIIQAESVEKGKDHIFIKSEYKIIRIKLENIKYIQGMREYVQIHLNNGKPVMTLLSLKSLEKELPEEHFMRVHKSYIVNLDQMTTIERHRIIFDENVRIPVSEQYKDKFDDYIEKKFIT